MQAEPLTGGVTSMKARDALLLALDPGQVLRAQGMTPDPWQQDLLLSRDREVLLNCARQSGKSTTVAALALHTALFLSDSLVLILSASLRQSGELYRKVLAGYEALGCPVAARSRSQERLELVNGSRVVCLPASEETIRGFSDPKLILVDEAARVPDNLYRSVRPMLSVGDGRILCLSTPFGRRGFFYEEWEHGGADWKRVRISAPDCPRIRPEFLDRERRSLGDSWVEQEFFCSFESFEGLVYPEFEIQTADGRDAPIGQQFGGIDWGFRNPFAAVWGRLSRDDVLTLTGERYLRETPLHEHARFLPRDVTWYADPAGPQEIASLIRANCIVRRARNDLRPGIAAVRARIQTGRLKIMPGACPNLLAEARLYRYPTRSDGRSESETPIDDNNHALDALRYIIASIDAAFLAKFRHEIDGVTGRRGDGVTATAPDSAHPVTPSPRHPVTNRPWLRLDNEALWH
jgi:hypothetical protein